MMPGLTVGVVSRRFGWTDVFAVASSGQLVHNFFNSDTDAWSGWENLPASSTAPVFPVSWGTNRLDGFFRGKDNAIWHVFWDGSAWHSESLGGKTLFNPTPITNGVNNMDVFHVGTDGEIDQNHFNGGWSGWVKVSNSLQYQGDISVLSVGNGYRIVAWATDGSYWEATNGSGGSILIWGPLGGLFHASPVNVRIRAADAAWLGIGLENNLWVNFG